jgi:hypothetical protein
MVGTARFELATSCSQGRRSDQAELSPEEVWGDVRGSNPQPPGSPPGALTD